MQTGNPLPNPKNIHEEQWLDISDFSAGAYSHDNTVSSSDRLLGAPPGAHDPAGTYSCLCLPNGGLGALAGVGQTWTWPDNNGTGSVINYVTGLLVHDEIGVIEAIVMIEWDDGTNHYFICDSYNLNASTKTNICATTQASGGLNEYPFGSPYPQMTRAADTNPTTTVGNPVCVFPVASFAYPNATAGQIFMYPSPATPTSYTPKKLITDTTPQSESGMILVHQYRVVVLANTGQSWPLGGAGVWVVNETINFTDPPNGDVYPSSATTGQQLIAVAEEPYGYGCGGSISAGELFLVKRRGGGVIITGDINEPTSITYLPGVQPTGGGYGNADSGVQGLFYCSIDNGAWVWNGSNTSQKISQQLDDSFFTGPNQAIYLSWYVRCIGDKVYFSNNWLYDTRTSSWWKYAPDATQGGTTYFWIQDVDGTGFYAAPITFLAANKTMLYRFDYNTPAQHYQWRSLPLKLSGEDRVADIREIVVRASCAGTHGTVSVSVLDKGNVVWGPTTMTGNVDKGPDMIRFTVAALGVTEPQIQINVDNSSNDDMPVIHSISVAYKQRAHQASTNA
jgi:hypothetical protein